MTIPSLQARQAMDLKTLSEDEIKVIEALSGDARCYSTFSVAQRVFGAGQGHAPEARKVLSGLERKGLVCEEFTGDWWRLAFVRETGR